MAAFRCRACGTLDGASTPLVPLAGTWFCMKCHPAVLDAAGDAAQNGEPLRLPPLPAPPPDPRIEWNERRDKVLAAWRANRDLTPLKLSRITGEDPQYCHKVLQRERKHLREAAD